MALTWKSVIRITWLPNVLLLFLVGWLIGGNQGWWGSVDRDNQHKLQQLEEKGTAVARENLAKINELAARLEKAELERRERYEQWTKWAATVEKERNPKPKEKL